jgi:hypothetical protein
MLYTCVFSTNWEKMNAYRGEVGWDDMDWIGLAQDRESGELL